MKDDIVNGQKVRCYDVGDGETADRYTAVYMATKRPRTPLMGPHAYNVYECASMSASPFHPQGVGMHSAATLGKHLGKRIPFTSLPTDCQKLIRQDTQVGHRQGKFVGKCTHCELDLSDFDTQIDTEWRLCPRCERQTKLVEK